MKPTNTRNYQTAQEALEVILKANNLGQSVKIDHNGDLFRAASPSNKLENFFLWFRKKSNSSEIKQSPEVLRTVINKMKIEIGIASTYLKNKESLRIPNPGKIINNYMKDVENIQTKTQMSELHTKWILINEDIKGAKDGMQSSMDRLETSSYAKISITDKKPINIPERVKESEQISTDLIADRQIAEANLCLPASMPKIQKTGEVVKGTLTISPEAQLNLFNEWPEWDTHHNAVRITSGDPFIGLSKAFQKDADRMNYVFESKGVAVECDKDKETVAIGFKQIAGKNPMRQLILSHLLGQEAVKSMLEKIQSTNPNSDGMPVIFFGTNTPGETKCRMHMSANDNGDVEIDYLYLSKCQNIGNSDMTAEINRSKKFDGPLSQENAATYMTMKILLKNSDLNRGELKFTVIEPLKLDIQVEIPNITKDT